MKIKRVEIRDKIKISGLPQQQATDIYHYVSISRPESGFYLRPDCV